MGSLVVPESVLHQRPSGPVSIATLEEILGVTDQPEGMNVAELERQLNCLFIGDPSYGRTDDYGHSMRVETRAPSLGYLFGVSPEGIVRLKTAGRYHDIGKVVIEQVFEDIKGKPTEEQWAEIRRHPFESYRKLIVNGAPQDVAELALVHHYDPKIGYPSAEEIFEITGKPVGDILPEARYLIVADRVDAMMLRGGHQRLYSAEETRKILRESLSWMPDSRRLIDAAIHIVSSPEYAAYLNKQASKHNEKTKVA